MSNLPERPYPADQVDVRPAYDGFVGYPKSEAYRWQSFAQLAIETDGYGDMSAIDPYSGRRLTAPVASVSGYGTGSAELSVYDQMRRLVDELERQGFLGRADKPGTEIMADAVKPEDAR
jgi:hypothetical protein